MKYNYEKEEHSDTHVTFKIKVAYDEYEKLREKKYEELAKDVEIKGFRKGMAPRKMVEPQIMSDVIEATIQALIPRVFSEIMDEENIELASSPEYEVGEIGKEDGVNFEAEVYTYGSFEVPEVDKFKVKVDEDVEISDEEVEETMENMLKNWNEMVENKEQKDVDSKQGSDNGKDQKEDVKSDNEKDSKEDVKSEQSSDLEMKKYDEINKEFIKRLGIQGVETKDELAETIKQELKSQKSQHKQQHAFDDVLTKMVKKSGIEVPENVIENIEKSWEKVFKQAITQSGKSEEEYLEEVDKTEEELKEDWLEKEKMMLKKEMLLSKYGRQEGLQLEPEVIKKLQEQYESKDQMYQVVNRMFMNKCANHLWSQLNPKEDKKKEKKD
jgi:trigger factor